MSKKRKTNTIKNLHLDKKTSHGGWPHGHSGSFKDPNTPVNKQISDYLKAMGLIDDDNPRAILSEINVINYLKSLIKESIVRQLYERNRKK